MSALLRWLTAPEWAHVVAALLHSLWQGAVVALALAVLMRRLTNPLARYRCALGALGLIAFAGCITWAILNTPQSVSMTDPVPPIETVSAPPPATAPESSPLDKVIVIGHMTRPEVQTNWTAWLALIWMAGAGIMLLRAGVKVAGAEKLRRSCHPLTDDSIAALVAEACRVIGLVRKIRVAVTDQLTSPAVVGVIVPTLILPLSLFTTLTPTQIQFVLLHELAHIRRGDYLANLFQLFAESLWFFNPAVWWISHQIRREREACCDALAIELSGAPADYARTLVHVAENILQPAPAAASAFGDDGREPSSLADRVQRLLVPGYRPALRLTWRAMLTALFVGGGLLFLSALGARNTVGAILTSRQTNTSSGSQKRVTTVLPTVSTDGFTNKATTVPVPGLLESVGYDLATAATFAPTPITSTGQDINTTLPLPIFRVRQPNNEPPTIGDLPGLGKLFTSESFAAKQTWFSDEDSSDMSNWTVGGPSQTNQQWFWYRTSETNVGAANSQPEQLVLAGTLPLPIYKSGKPFVETKGIIDWMFNEQSAERQQQQSTWDFSIKPEPFPKELAKGRAGVLQRLDHIRLDHYSCHQKPLRELLTQLSEAARQQDPTEDGINFSIKPAFRDNPASTNDPGNVLITISTNYTEASLGTILYIIVGNAETPIKYSIQDQGVVFYFKEKNNKASNGSAAQNTKTPPAAVSRKQKGLLLYGGFDHSAESPFELAPKKASSLNPSFALNSIANDNLQSRHLNGPDLSLIDPKPPASSAGLYFDYSIVGIPTAPSSQEFSLSRSSPRSKTLTNHASGQLDQANSVTNQTVSHSSNQNATNQPPQLAASSGIDPHTASTNQPETLVLAERLPLPIYKSGKHVNATKPKVILTEVAQENLFSSTRPAPALIKQSNDPFGFWASIGQDHNAGERGMIDWAVAETSAQREQWFWYRTGGTGYESPIAITNGQSTKAETFGVKLRTTSTATNKQASEPLYTRTFDLPPDVFYGKFLTNLLPATRNPTNASIYSQLATTGLERVREQFRQLGVDLEPQLGKSMFYSSRGGLFVRATKSDLDTIEAALQELSPPIPLFPSRSFPVEPTLIGKLIEQAVPQYKTNLEAGMLPLFKILGVDLSRPKSVHYNSHTHELFVNAPTNDLDTVAQILRVLNIEPQQVNLKVRWVEMPTSVANELLSPISTVSVEQTNVAHVLSTKRMEGILSRLKARDGIGLLSEGQVTTFSDRQAQLQVAELKTVLTGINPKALTSPGIVSTNSDGAAALEFQAMPFGPLIDVLPHVNPDLMTITLHAIPSFKEFLGYEKNSPEVAVYVNGKQHRVTQPLPRFRTRQMTNDVTLWDGQTLVLGNLPTTEATSNPDGRLNVKDVTSTTTNNLYVFITATLIDPAGNPINKDMGLPSSLIR